MNVLSRVSTRREAVMAVPWGSLLAVSLVVMLLGVTPGVAPAQEPPTSVFEVSITPEASAGADSIFACCGEGFTPNSSVAVQIFDSPGGTSLFGPASVPTDFEGSFSIGPETHGLDLVAGMHVVVTDDTTGIAKDLILADITFEGFDPDADTASGTAPPGAEVAVEARGPVSFFCCVSAVADGSGNWVADFGAEGFDVTPGMGGTVHLGDTDGDTTRAGIACFCPNFNVDLTPGFSLNADTIFACCENGFTPNSSVSVQAFDAPGGTSLFGPASVPTDSEGGFSIGPETHGLDLVAGMHVVVTDDTTSIARELILADITFDALDADTDTASGTAPPGAEITVEAGNQVSSFCCVGVTADGSGNWVADFGAEGFDITPGMGGAVGVDDAFGSTTRAGIACFCPAFSAILTPASSGGADTIDSCCEGAFTPNSSVTVQIFDSSGGTSLFGPASIPTDFEGGFSIGPETHGLDLVAGMHVVVTDDTIGIAKDLVLADITFDALDPATDTASGTAPPGAQLGVEVADLDSFFSVSVVADGSGNWFADFGAEGFDITPGMGGAVVLGDADGDFTQAGIACFCPVFEVSITPEASAGADSIFACCGEGFTPNSSVSVQIFDSPGGTSLFGPAEVPTDFEGSFSIGPETHGLDLVAGMHVVVTDDTTGVAKDLVLADITFDVLDPATDTASGTAPPGAQLGVEVRNEQSEFCCLGVVADASGHWFADLGAEGFDVLPGMGGTVHLEDTDRDTTRAGIPIAEADLSVATTDAPDPVRVGRRLTYAVRVMNLGPDRATGIVLTDTLPTGVTFVSATTPGGTCAQAGGVVTCGLAPVRNGGSATVLIVVRPTAPGTLVNSAQVAANETDNNADNNADSETTTVR